MLRLSVFAATLFSSVVLWASSLPLDVPSYGTNTRLSDEELLARGLVRKHQSAILVGRTGYNEPTIMPYSVRRQNRGFQVSISAREYRPFAYRSVLDGNPYLDAFGDRNFQFLEISLGRKYNWSFGSMAIDLGVGTVQMQGIESSEERRLDLTKFKLGGILFLDRFWNEPYLTPYFGSHVYILRGTEQARLSGSNESFSFTTDPSLEIRMGLLFQLNWLESSASVIAYDRFGIENTFLDIYVAQMMDSPEEGSADFGTEPLLGAGLRIEF